MRTKEEIQKEIEYYEYQRHIEEMADDFFYTNGKAGAYDRKIRELKKELQQNY